MEQKEALMWGARLRGGGVAEDSLTDLHSLLGYQASSLPWHLPQVVSGEEVGS